MTENITEMYGIKCYHIVMVLGKIYKFSGFGEHKVAITRSLQCWKYGQMSWTDTAIGLALESCSLSHFC